MDLTNYLTTFYKILTQDEELKRLLVYKPKNALDNPLSKDKPDIGNDWKQINKVIKMTPKTDDFNKEAYCAVRFYLGLRPESFDNVMVTSQDIVFDIYAHYTFDEVDMRLVKITDRVNKLIKNKRVGANKARLRMATTITNPPNGFTAHKLVFQFGSVN
ncbi:hypothetical protein [Priestia megaterium]|uniref:hypothetical protein n=1 Tax=Priestia megaterium TaxID=1404 RepID=UPI0011272BE7|nr:hypothetical protein [Priestia megaterium]TPF17934.1 hypothetical protein CBE78_01550 [Priestia megaterium]TPF22042.1 hypothetical protein CBE79_04055 [Priestia megaterium]